MKECTRNTNGARRDRLMQWHLAQARGPVRNGDLLRSAVDQCLRFQSARRGEMEGLTVDNALVDTLSTVTESMNGLNIVYAVTGSIASSVHGEPYMSQDVDLIVHATPEQMTRLALSLAPRFYAPADMLSQAARDHVQANVVDNKNGLKADISPIPKTGFLADAMSRRVRTRIGSASPEFWFVTPEDVILMKLDWRRGTQSAKQWDNALGVARIQGVKLDWKYMFDQARSLDLEDDLVKVRDEAGI